MCPEVKSVARVGHIDLVSISSRTRDPQGSLQHEDLLAAACRKPLCSLLFLVPGSLVIKTRADLLIAANEHIN